jgi:hypothetical protein
MTYNEILAEVSQLNSENLQAIEQLERQWNANQWAWTPEPSRWSAIQCIEHLNLSNNAPIDQIANQIKSLRPADGQTKMKHGFIATYLVNSFMKRENKMVAPQNLEPQLTYIDSGVIGLYKKNNERLQQLLGQLHNKDLVKARIETKGRKMPEPKIGDVLRMIIHHDRRHIEQAQRMAQLEGFPKK